MAVQVEGRGQERRLTACHTMEASLHVEWEEKEEEEVVEPAAATRDQGPWICGAPDQGIKCQRQSSFSTCRMLASTLAAWAKAALTSSCHPRLWIYSSWQ